MKPERRCFRRIAMKEMNSKPNANLDFINKIGLKEHLSPTRANGLVSMIKNIKMYALAFNSQN